MFCWMMLACIIGTIVYAVTPQVKELAFCIAAFEPVEAFIHQGLGVGGDHGAFELWMSHFFESHANGDGKCATVVKCSRFRFGS